MSESYGIRSERAPTEGETAARLAQAKAERERDEARQLAEAETNERIHLDKQRLAERALADRLAGALERIRDLDRAPMLAPDASEIIARAALAEHAAARAERPE